ncbi:MAG TPA: ubiquinol oxidase subunit II [Candidatus Saccharimonadales bacterium]|nr:ubiquinol oxidase subunit II [Candidatus Saccharimonadales bacterium]
MRGKYLKGVGLILAIVIAVLALAVVVRFFEHHDIAVLQPKGTIGHKERNLMLLAVGLCAIVVIPVFTLTILIARRYREGNKKNDDYNPDWDGDRRLELTWWGIPLAIITILAVVTWFSSYSLDPYRALASTQKTMNIQVIAMDWKWLFIYPDQNIATVNYVRFPVNTPVDFSITSDSVMNSFWIPNLGGQIYAMPGMATHLHLMADKTGSYPGSSANISGRGFADMRFVATASDQTSFDSWLRSVKTSTQGLNAVTYDKLSQPSTSPVAYYSRAQSGLFNAVISNYMIPASLHGGMEEMH